MKSKYTQTVYQYIQINKFLPKGQSFLPEVASYLCIVCIPGSDAVCTSPCVPAVALGSHLSLVWPAVGTGILNIFSLDLLSIMDDKDIDTEIHPLKNNDGKFQESNVTDPEKETVSKKQSGLSRLSRCRTAAFFSALFLCLAVVFAFSFIIPCPVRPYSQRTWIAQYDSAGTFGFLSTEDVNQDKVKDVIFLVKTDNTSNFNVSCMDKGFQSPCTFLVALSGTNGSALWIIPVADEVQLAECGIQNLGGVKSGCLIIGTPYFASAIDSQTGKQLWTENTSTEANAVVKGPVVKIPDVNGDDIQDFILIFTVENELRIVTLSGHRGDCLRKDISIGTREQAGHHIFVTKTGAQYVLFYKGDVIEGYSINNLYSRNVEAESKNVAFNQDPDWEKRFNHSGGYIPLLPVSSSGDVLYLITVPGKYYKNLLIVKSEVSELLDGQKLNSLWSLNTSNIISKPALGYFKKNLLSVIIEVGIGNGRKKVIIIESNSGSIQWQLEMNVGISNPNPATLSTGDHRSIFLFWGSLNMDTNETMEPKDNLYMFHPTLPNVLLELNNRTENIVMFDGLLHVSSWV
ncbi:protein FAM234A isoform X2 [Xenopus tropicalis]|uniref:Protein FAM234A isoform X2 n=1 Tax=Xenopus tropicalis TaxID=8364 RepID=A0A8J1IS15_XENTR|nr:protein FAM234A isoform X2 [Xenopus tropicalis]